MIIFGRSELVTHDVESVTLEALFDVLRGVCDPKLSAQLYYSAVDDADVDFLNVIEEHLPELLLVPLLRVLVPGVEVV